MKVGLTYDLRSWYLDRGYSMEDTAEFDKQDTVDALDQELRKIGFETEQIGNCFQLIEALASKKKWDLVFNIAEGLYGDGRESVVTRLIVSAAGVPVSPGTLISSMDDVKKCNLEYPLFIKPVSEGTGKGINEKSLITSPSGLKEMAEWILSRFNQPALVEEYLPGREFTVGVIGTGEESVAIGGMEIECRENLPYSIEVKENYLELCKYVPIEKEYNEKCKSVALKVWKALGAVDGGRVDLKADRNGQICFIEVNPLAGLHPIHSDLPILSRMTGIEYQTLIEMIMKAALKRHNLTL